MASRFRLLLLLGIAALCLLTVAWLVSVLGFKTSPDTAIAVCGVLAPIFFGLVAAAQAVLSRAPADSADARERLSDVVNQQIAEQANALTARGVMTVPWTGGDEAATAIQPSPEARLADAVAAGRQLIVIGGSQSGKTTLATRLAKSLAGLSGAQPVLFSLSTWNPAQVRLSAWMLQTMQTAYGLSSAAEAEAAETTLRQRTIIPVFDGLDEIDAGFRITAADAIHQLIGSSAAVLTSIANEDAAELALQSAETIRLTPVGADEVSRYLVGDRPAGRGDGPLARLAARIVAEPGSEVAQALSSPLMAWLAKAVYGGGQASASSGVVPLEQLLDAKRDDIEKQLLRSLPAAVFARYQSSPSGETSPSKVTPDQADSWLRFLADRATRRIIAFWEFRSYAPLFRIALAAAAVLGCLIAVIGTAVPYLAGPGYFLLLAGAMFGFAWSRGYSVVRDRIEDPTRIGYGYGGKQHDGDLNLHALRFVRAVAAAAVAYVAGVITQAGLGHHGWTFGLSGSEFAGAAVTATVLCYVVANIGGRLAGWILMRRPNIDSHMGARAGDPLGAISSDFRSGCAIVVVATVTLAAGIAVYDVVMLPSAATWIWNICLAPAGAIVAAFIWNEWICFKVAHLWLVVRGRLPGDLSGFLRQCHEGGILRKNGNHFEFRHRRLQESLQSPGAVASVP